MSQTKHRAIKTDDNSQFDEVEQKLHIKDYRRQKKQVVEDELFDDDYDEGMKAEIEYLLGKGR